MLGTQQVTTGMLAVTDTQQGTTQELGGYP